MLFQIKSLNVEMCLDTMHKEQGNKVGFFYCHTGGGPQVWMITSNDHIRHDQACLDGGQNPGDPVSMFKCIDGRERQMWNFDSKVTTKKSRLLL